MALTRADRHDSTQPDRVRKVYSSQRNPEASSDQWRCVNAESEACGGFTLVELLVVIGIIALLIAILLPALKKGDSANTTKCASNLRQIALAIISYANDNKGRLLPSAVNPGDLIYPKGWFLESARSARITFQVLKASTLRESRTMARAPSTAPRGIDEDVGFSGFDALTPRAAKNQQYVLKNSADVRRLRSHVLRPQFDHPRRLDREQRRHARQEASTPPSPGTTAKTPARA